MIVIRRKVYIPEKYRLSKRKLKKYFEYASFDDTVCQKCSLKNHRPCSECHGCSGYNATIRLWNTFTDRNGRRYYTLPNGDLPGISKAFDIDMHGARDLRACPKMQYPLKFTATLYHGQKIKGVQKANQQKVAKQWLRKRYGIIKASPRSGKTVIATYCICACGVRTIVFAHQQELLKQFLRTVEGGVKAGEYCPAFTNIKALRKRYKRPIIGMVTKPEDLDKYDICLVNYQKFISQYGPERISKHLLRKFGLVIVDEAHHGAALAYLKVLNSLDCRYKMCLTATDHRTDGADVMLRRVMGPVVAVSDLKGVLPKITLHETGVTYGGYANYTTMLKRICKNKGRNQDIVRMVFADLRAGHKVIIIPIKFKDHMSTIVTMINKQAAVNRVKRHEKWPKQLALPFYNGSPRDDILRWVDSGVPHVLVAIQSMIKEGIDMMYPSMLYQVIPASAKPQPIGSPLFEQQSNRVCTPSPKKPMAPEVRIFIDNVGISYNCFKNLWRYEIVPKLDNTFSHTRSYLADPATRQRAEEIVRARKYTPRVTGKEIIATAGW